MQRDGVPHQGALALEPFLAARARKRRILAALVPLVLVEAGLRVVRPLAHVAPEHRRPIEPFEASGAASFARRRAARGGRHRRRRLAAALGRNVIDGGRNAVDGSRNAFDGSRNAVDGSRNAASGSWNAVDDGRRRATAMVVDHDGSRVAAVAAAAIVVMVVIVMVTEVTGVCNRAGKTKEKTTLEERDA